MYPNKTIGKSGPIVGLFIFLCKHTCTCNIHVHAHVHVHVHAHVHVHVHVTCDMCMCMCMCMCMHIVSQGEYKTEAWTEGKPQE